MRVELSEVPRSARNCVRVEAHRLNTNLCIDRYFCLFMSIINIKNCSGNAVCNLGRSKILKKLVAMRVLK